MQIIDKKTNKQRKCIKTRNKIFWFLYSNLTKFAGYLKEKNNLKYPEKPNQLGKGMTRVIMMDHLVSS